jgi:hypothetical protein
MAGDQIVADWLGDVYSNNVQAVTAPTRFSATSLRYRSVHIYNTDIAASVYIGQFFAASATFDSKALVVGPKETILFKFVDLYELGHGGITADVWLRVLGLNKY